MDFKYLTLAFLISNFILSLLLWHIIYSHISKKPILSVSLVDLIYKDTIIYIVLMSFFASAGIIHTLVQSDEHFSLALEFALVHSVCINISVTAICISLIISAGLRLLALIKNSEAAGKSY